MVNSSTPTIRNQGRYNGHKWIVRRLSTPLLCLVKNFRRVFYMLLKFSGRWLFSEQRGIDICAAWKSTPVDDAGVGGRSGWVNIFLAVGVRESRPQSCWSGWNWPGSPYPDEKSLDTAQYRADGTQCKKFSVNESLVKLKHRRLLVSSSLNLQRLIVSFRQLTANFGRIAQQIVAT